MSEHDDLNWQDIWTAIAGENPDLQGYGSDQWAVPVTLFQLSSNIGALDMMTLSLTFPTSELQEWANLVHYAIEEQDPVAQQVLMRWCGLLQDGVTNVLQDDPQFVLIVSDDEDEDEEE